MQDHDYGSAQPLTTNEPSIFAPGHILGGKYKVMSVLGKGGMGTVYKVVQMFLNKEFAVKVLDSRRVFDDVQVRRFQMEAKAANALSNPALVKVHDFGLLDNNQPYLVMDLVEGTTLVEYIQNKGFVPLDQIAPLFTQVCRGLAYAHEQSVVHRDIKPSNIMIVNGIPLGADGSVKILDFGIAKIGSDEGGEIQQLTRTGEIFGSPLYMSPEQCTGDIIDNRSDIYSLGCVMFEALTGTPPHFGSNALRTMMMHQSEPAPLLKEASLGREFPKSFETMLQRMLQKAPHQRFQDLTAVIEALNTAATDSKVVEISPLKPKPEPRQAKLISLSVSKLYGLVLAAVITSSAVTASVMYHLQKAQDQIEAQKHAQMPVQAANKTQDQTAALAGDRELSNLIKLSEPDKKVDWSITAAEMKPRLVDTAEGKQKLLHFPKEPIGKVSNRLAGELCDWKFPYHDLMAVGDVRMPADIPLTLEVSASAHPAVYNSPEIFGKIDPAEFSELLLRGSPMNDINKESKGLARILSYAKKWTNLVSLGLYSVSVQKDAIDQINQMEKIRYLLIEGDAIAGAGAIKPEFLSRLKYLMIIQNPRDVSAADKICSYIAGSSNFEQLELQRTSVSPAAIDKLRSCPNLTKVTLIGAVHETEKYRTISDELLNAFLKLPKLKTLELKWVDVSPEQFKTIADNTLLKKIVVSPALMPSFKRSGCNDPRFIFNTK